MSTILLIAVSLHAVGLILFGHFETHTPVARRLFKLAFNLGLTALLYQLAGAGWALGFVLGFLALGLGVHFWWTRRHGIHPFTAEPRAKYYVLRGWQP